MTALKQKSKKPIFSEESIETHGNSGIPASVAGEGKKLSKAVVDSFWNELLGGSFKSSTEQIAKPAPKKMSGDMKMGEEVSLKEKKHNTEYAEVKNSHFDMLKGELHQEYYQREVANIELKKVKEVEQSIKQQVEDIRSEIKALIKSSKQMEAVFKDVAATVDAPIEKPGSYHINFYNWVISAIRSARARIEEGVSWGKTMSNKRAEKQYAAMAKKHGTSFTLHHDRTPATQSG
jgi:hypothetical protein